MTFVTAFIIILRRQVYIFIHTRYIMCFKTITYYMAILNIIRIFAQYFHCYAKSTNMIIVRPTQYDLHFKN